MGCELSIAVCAPAAKGAAATAAAKVPTIWRRSIMTGSAVRTALDAGRSGALKERAAETTASITLSAAKGGDAQRSTSATICLRLGLGLMMIFFFSLGPPKNLLPRQSSFSILPHEWTICNL